MTAAEVQAMATQLEEARAKTAALEQAVAQQKTDLEGLRAHLTTQAAEERALREKSDATITARVDETDRRLEETPPVRTKSTGVALSGFVHVDMALRQSSEDELNGSTGDPLNEDRFSIRRARLRATIDDQFVSGALEIDGNTTKGATARLIGAEVSLKLPPPAGADVPIVLGTLGLFKIPFGFEVLESDRDRLFLERSTFVRALFPGEYDLGARIAGGWRFLRYAIAAQNGEPIGERAFPTRDPNAAKDITGRLGFQASIVEGIGLVLGVSGVKGTGFHKGTPATKTTFTWQDRNEDGRFQTGEIVLVPGVSSTSSQNFSRHALGIDARLLLNLPRLGQTAVYGELVLANNLDRGLLPADPLAGAGRDLRELGYYVALTQELGGHVSVGVRYDLYNPDRDSSVTEQARPVPEQLTYKTVALTAALRGRAGRLIIEYDVNRNHQGRDLAGLPTNLKDNVFAVRGETKF